MKWKEWRDDDVVEERRRLEEADRLKRERTGSAEDQRRESLEAVARGAATRE